MLIEKSAYCRLAVVVGLFGFWITVVWADAVDPASRLQEDVRRAETVRPVPAPAWQAPAAKPLQLPDGPVLKGKIFLQEVLFSPSQLLSDKQLGDLVRPYVGRSVGSDELNALLRDIQALYLALGVQSAVPVVPPQDLQTGVIKILLVEGTLGQVKFAGSTKPDPAWLAQWFDMTPGQVIRPEPLARRLDVFNASSDFMADGQYVAGQSFGTSDLEVTVPELATTQFWAMSELPGVGSGRTLGNSLIMGFRHYPVSSVGGRLDGMVIQGPSTTTLSLSGGLPIGHQGWRLGANTAVSRSRQWLQAAENFEYLREGAATSFGVDVTRHVVVAPGQLWRISAGLTSFRSQSVFLSENNRSTLQKATLAAATDWLVHPGLGQERGSLRASLNSAKGQANSFSYAEIYSALAYRVAGPEGPVLRGNVQWRLLDKHSPDISDLWMAGGSASVRGFDPGAVYGRSGHAMQVALYQPLPWKSVDTPEAFVFVDQARAVKDSLSDRIGSTGLGVQFQMDRRWAIETALTHQTHGFQGPRTRLLLKASVAW